jgi:hypothetical protein
MTRRMNLGLAALLYFGGTMAVGLALVYAYTVITGDTTGEHILPGKPTNQTAGGNYTLPKINAPMHSWFAPTSKANAAAYYSMQDLSAEEERPEPWALRLR